MAAAACVQPEQRPALIEQGGLGRIQVLGFFAMESASPHGDEFAALISDGDDDPAAETVIALAAVFALH